MTPPYSRPLLVVSLLAACASPEPPESRPAGSPDARAAVDAAPERAAPAETWRVVADGVPPLLGLWGRSPGELYVVGGRDGATAIGRWDGSSLAWEENPGDRRAWWVTGFADAPVTFVVGERGLGLVRDGSGPWTSWPTGVDVATLFGAWGSAPDDVWVVGGDLQAGRPLLRHWDGAAWSDAALPPLDPMPAAFFKVWGDRPDRVHVVGDRGVALRFDGRVWTRAVSPSDDAMLTLHGPRDGAPWAVGGRARGVVWRHEGGEWHDATPGEGLPPLAGVYAASDGTVLVGGHQGTLLERDAAGSWRSLPRLTRHLLHTVWITEDGTRWAAGADLLNPRGPSVGVLLRGPGAPPPAPSGDVADAGAPASDAGSAADSVTPEDASPPVDQGPVDAAPPDAWAPHCAPGWIRGRGVHRLYLQGRQGTPDASGRYPLLEERDAIVHGEHYLLGQGAFAEWTARLCADLSRDVYFYLPNNDEAGSEVLHQLFLVRDGLETLVAETRDLQAGMSGYNPFVDRPAAADLEARAGDELRLRSTNLADVMYSVMVFNPPSEYMSYLEIELVEDGPPVAGRIDDEAPGAACQPGVQMGRGEVEFEPLEPGGAVPLVTGPQGSFMLFLGLRVVDVDGGNPEDPLDPANPLVELRARLADGDIGNLRQRVGFTRTAGGTLEVGGLVLTVNPDRRAAELVGHPVAVAATITDRNGVRRCGEALVTPSAP